jgi:emfourin
MLKIEAIQTGLQAPVPKAWSLDSAEASPNEIAEIKRLVKGCNFLYAPEPVTDRSAPDRGTISIFVTTLEGSRRLTFALGHVPKEFVPLVRFIESRLQWRPRKP